MENINVKIEILSCVYDELNEQDKALVDLAKQATANSYSPYSHFRVCLLYTSPSPRDRQKSRMPSSA